MKFTLSFIIFFLSIELFAQEDTSEVIIPDDPEVEELEEMKFEEVPIITVEGTDPEFPGGEQALFSYVQKNMIYPDTAIALGIQGIVYAQFVIDTLGSVTDIKIIRGVHWSLDDETERLLRTMPKWNPGTNPKGEAVRVRFTLPFHYSLH